MANQKCPSCGKKIAAQASVCIYCSTELEKLPVRQESIDTQEAGAPKRSRKKQGKGWLVVSAVSLLVIVVMAVVIVMFPVSDPLTPISPETTTTFSTAPTRDAVRDAWLHTFTGRWYDEDSVGKSDIQTMGGQTLFIHDILNDQVLFDLYVYSGGDNLATAFVKDTAATLVEDTLHFTFSDDGCGHSGEGYMRFTDDGIQMEVMLDEPVLEGEHSLALNAVFKRSSVPSSEGVNLLELHTLADVVETAGRQTADPITDDEGNTVYTFGMLQVTTNAAGDLTQMTVDYTAGEDKTGYSFDEIDGTMGYETVKTYFGDAQHDYVEQPTDICVLYYVLEDGATVTFTFDAGEDLLIHIQYLF